MKAALVYDRVNKWGGAERVLLALHEMFPQAPLYTSVYNPETAPWARVFDVRTSFLQNFPYAPSTHELYALLMPLAFESFNFDNYDLVISVTSEAAKGIITKPGTFHLCYCLTPTRYLWSGYDAYFKEPITKFFTKPIVSYLRNWDKIAAHRPDVMVAISETVKERIKRYYMREVEVIYPPVEIGNSEALRGDEARIGNVRRNTPDVTGLVTDKRPYFLIVSRLVPYKRVDLAIGVFNQLKLPLIIIGTGREEGKLKSIAGPTITFVGQLTDEELARYYEKATALIFPQEEDFGIVAVEAQRMGTPVIAYKSGGATETVLPGKTGEFFFPQTTEALIDVVQRFDKSRYDLPVLTQNAKRFSKERFKKEFLKILNRKS